MPVIGRALRDPRLKRLLYRSGALDAWHRRRNRDRLTVIMFHRIIAREDPRWATSDPEYTLPADLFAASLAFFRRHYNVISLETLLAARKDDARLPERPLLITFDDGWSDNEEFALAALGHAGMPAVIFVVADAVDRRQPFWQEQMITAWKSGRLDRATAQRLLRDAGPVHPPAAPAHPHGDDDLTLVRTLIAALEQAVPATRARILDGIAALLDDGGRYMLTTAQLRTLAAGGVAIGAHGQTHAPLTEVDAKAELIQARQRLEQLLGGARVTTLSFPHGRYDAHVIDEARAAGYQLLFTSVPELPAASGRSRVLGRVGFTAETITDHTGQFAPERLALHLFRKPHAAR